MAEEPRSLKSVFNEAEQKRLALESTYEASSPSYRHDLETVIKDYEQCIQTIYAVSIFSANEPLDDIATSDLPYLLVNYHLAELVQKISSTSPHDRQASLETAREAYERFLGQLDSYGAVQPPYDKLYSRYTDEPLAFSTIAGADANARRNTKIANFKAEKELKGRLEYLRRNPRYLEDGDEEAVRELHLANLTYCMHMAFQGLEGINRELDILAQATVPLLPQQSSVEEDERRRVSEQQSDGYSERLDQPLKRLQSLFNSSSGPLLSQNGKPLQPFTLVGSRQELRNGVFRPGHNLPTMSIDDYLDEERRRGGIIDGGGEASYARPEADEDNMERADEETMKAREWDEFKEANPRGAGNTLNRG
jgi:immunoglobulin-binding protein 1